MISTRRRWWLLGALVPLAYLPLRAQETPPAQQAPVTVPAEAASSPAPITPAEPVAPPSAGTADEEQELSREDRVSADNSLSFPVDI